MKISNNQIIKLLQIQTIVANETGIKVSDITAKNRKANIVQARHLSMHFSRWYVQLPLLEIAKLHGQINHATVIHADNCISYDIRKNAKLNAIYLKIQEQVKSL